jgi:hypothetical protein
VRHHESGAIVPVRAEPDAVLREIEWLQSRRNDWTRMGALGRSSAASECGLAAMASRYAELCGVPRRGGA